jgi:1-acyl-sn-glycerol-3-phosphate acyltransferase
MDAVMIFGCIDRPVKFVMYYKIFNIPFFRFMFNAVGAIPIAGRNEDENVFNQAFDKINQYLMDGEIVVIFPEGKITSDGQLNEFKPGLLKILERNPVDVYPSALSGLWGSMYSRKDKSILRYFPKAFFTHKVTYTIGDKINASDVQMDRLQDHVKHLRGENL